MTKNKLKIIIEDIKLIKIIFSKDFLIGVPLSILGIYLICCVFSIFLIGLLYTLFMFETSFHIILGLIGLIIVLLVEYYKSLIRRSEDD